MIDGLFLLRVCALYFFLISFDKTDNSFRLK